MKTIDYVGKKFNRLLVLEVLSGGKHPRLLCLCDCGSRCERAPGHLRSGASASCGCKKVETIRRIFTKHGMTGTPEFSVWRSAKRRCSNPKDRAWPYYGGRGIKMCKEWADSFAAFYAALGPRPKGKTLDRIDNSRGYEPGNCRWATWSEQRMNQRRMNRVAHD